MTPQPPAPGVQKARRHAYDAAFKLRVVRAALRRPAGDRIKPTCREFGDIEPVQLRKWISNLHALERALPTAKCVAAINPPADLYRHKEDSISPHMRNGYQHPALHVTNVHAPAAPSNFSPFATPSWNGNPQLGSAASRSILASLMGQQPVIEVTTRLVLGNGMNNMYATTPPSITLATSKQQWPCAVMVPPQYHRAAHPMTNHPLHQPPSYSPSANPSGAIFDQTPCSASAFVPAPAYYRPTPPQPRSEEIATKIATAEAAHGLINMACA